jgi:hypothetical protein
MVADSSGSRAVVGSSHDMMNLMPRNQAFQRVLVLQAVMVSLLRALDARDTVARASA